MKPLAIGVILFMLNACSSKVEQASTIHSKEVSQWQDLAKFAGNELVHFRMSISADIVSQKNSNSDELVISNVKLVRTSSDKKLDLLSPEFVNIFTCEIDCVRLNKFLELDGVSQTKISQFFEEKEGDFFRFYGRLSKLNKQLTFYRNIAPKELGDYLSKLVTVNRGYDSLSDFLDTLDNQLKYDSFEEFIKNGNLMPNPIEKYKRIGLLSNDLPVNGEKNLDLPVKEVNDLDIDGINDLQVAEFAPLDLVVSFDSTGDELLLALLVSEDEKKLSNNYEKNIGWVSAKMKPVMVGDVVCTFSDSRFGVVSDIYENFAQISLGGQAMIIDDGVNLIPSRGYLFSEMEEFYFLELEAVEEYGLSDIAACDVDYLRKGKIAPDL